MDIKASIKTRENVAPLARYWDQLALINRYKDLKLGREWKRSDCRPANKRLDNQLSPNSLKR